MTLGTAVHGIGTHGHTPHGGITDGTIHSITEGFMIHGTMVMADGTDICTHITADGMEDGIHTGTTIITTTMTSI